eukprot:scaffold749_cov90-Skeletonema_dohrnii-CCMP3373.AAC.10
MTTTSGNNSTPHIDITSLSLSDKDSRGTTTTNNNGNPTSPNLTSFTPPPPGFDTAATANNNKNNSSIAAEQTPHRKSPSFNNLAMALGTGLAECMDNSTSDHTNHTTMSNNNNMNNTNLTAGLDQMDNYARQSRHAVTRLIGHSQFQQQQREGRGSVPPGYLNGGASAGGGLSLQYLSGGGVNGGVNGNGGGDSGGNNSGQQQQQVRFTAAMMAQQTHNPTTQHHPSLAAGNNNNHHQQELNTQQQQLQMMGQTTQFLNGGDHHLLQMHHQQQQQQQVDGGGATNLNTNGGSINLQSTYNPLTKQQAIQFQQQQQPLQQTYSYQGVTVVEPNSARNSPAILNPHGSNSNSMSGGGDGLLYTNIRKDGDLFQQQQGGGNHGGNQGIVSNPSGDQMKMGGLPLLSSQGGGQPHPQLQQQQQPQVGGRASAPPSNLTTGGGRTASVLHHTAMGHPNLRAFTASSLQMRVAELHQELGNGGGGSNVVGGGNVGGSNVGVVGGPTPPSSRPTTPGQPQQQGHQQQQQLRTIIVTSATPPLHPNTPQRMVINTPPPPGHVLVTTTTAGPPGAPSQSNNTNNSRPATPATISPEQREREQVAAQELEPFLKRRDTTSDDNTSSATAAGGGGGSSASSSKNSSSGSSNASSRGLAILYASTLTIPDVRSTCEAFGALESFRSDFAETKGVVFATFYDLRSAQMAVVELPKALNKMIHVSSGGSSGVLRAVEVEYCVPLNASSATDESMLMLSNLPGSVDEQDLSRMLSSFGEVRAVHYQANMMSSGGDGDDEEEEEEEDLASYMVEFFDVQDARQALMELEQTNSWGGRAGVKVATRSPAKRKQGKELILLMSNWRQGVPPKQPGEVNNAPSRTPSPPAPVVVKQHSPPPPSSSLTADTTQTGGHVHHAMPAGTAAHSYYQYAPHQGDIQQQYAAQLVMGPDGHYQYMLVNHGGHYAHPGQMVIDPHQQQLMYTAVDPQYMHMNQQQYHHIQYANTIPGANYTMPLSHDIQQQQQQPPTQFIAMPSNTASRGGEGNSSSLSSDSQSPLVNRSKASTRTLSAKSNASIGSGSGGSSGNNSGGNTDENNDLALFIENVKSGKDLRSSLMVRNIPNKYTQQMLLGEFAAVGHGPDKMDFFYLPIDFKNKCNRGYAFVNFVDYKDIVPFFDEYNGTSWKRFNSDKICDITYARIQGKAAMLKRFENSALMAKDDEYRPMVFVSHGERKGQRECFG